MNTLSLFIAAANKPPGFKVYDNNPAVGFISWSDLHIVYNGTDYTIDDGNTDKKYIFWDYSVSTTVLQTSDTIPVLEEYDFLVFLNKNGTHVTVPTITTIDGSLIVSESILTDALSANCVTSPKILAGAVTAEKIAVDSVIAEKIKAGEVNSTHLTTESAVITQTAQIQDAIITGAKITNLSVTDAQIANASIKTAKIDELQVTTNKIAIEAVNAPHSAYTEGKVDIGLGWTTLQSVSIGSTGCQIFIQFSGLMKHNDAVYVYFRIYRDDTYIYSCTMLSSEIYPISFNISDIPGAGEYTYYIKAYRGDVPPASITNRSLFVMETKR